MNIVILTHLPLNEILIHEWLDLSVHNVHLFIDREGLVHTLNFSADIARRYASIHVYNNYITNGQVESDVLELSNSSKIDLVLGYGEDDVIRSARLRERLGLEGQTETSSRVFRDKALMCEQLKLGNIPIPRFIRVNNPMDLIQFSNEVGFPIFIKPTLASGSIYARKINNKHELYEYLGQGLTARIPYGEYVSDLIAEEYIEGQLYHIDGLVNNGKTELCWPSKYLSRNLELSDNVLNDICGSYLLEPANPICLQLQNFTVSILNAMPCPKLFAFHAEVFVKENGEMIVCEVAARTGGGRINTTLKTAFGISLNEALLISEISDSWTPDIHELPQNLAGFVMFCPNDCIFISGPEKCPLPYVTHYNLLAHPGQEFTNREFSGQSAAYFVVIGDSEEEVQNRIEEVIMWFKASSVIQNN